jgi:hypothetical protein
VRVAANLRTGEVEMTKPIVITDEEHKRRVAALPHPDGCGPEKLAAVRDRVKKAWKRAEHHWVLSMGTRGDVNTGSWSEALVDSWPSAFAFQAGSQWNIWPRKLRLTRVTAETTLDVNTDGPRGLETGGSVDAYYDVGGILAIGAGGTVGAAHGDVFDRGDEMLYYGFGPRLKILEGALKLGVTRTSYRDKNGVDSGNWQYPIMFDLMAWLRAQNLVDKDL